MDREKLLSMDPYILLSIVNMKLRDECSSLEDFCHRYGVKSEEIEGRLEKIDYKYNEKNNQFIGV